MRILAVDDSADAVEVMAELLRLDGNEVESMTDSTVVSDAVRRFRPHVVLLDLSMPLRDGFAVASELRAEPAFKDVILVALTGHAGADVQRRTRETGFDHHLLKPVDFDALSRLMAACRRAAEAGDGF